MHKNIHLYTYVFKYTYTYSYISEINDGNDTGTGGRSWDYFVIMRYLQSPWSGIMLFESGLGLVVNVYCKL